MKGFIHVLEIIIVALALFLVIALFIYIPRIESDWMKTKLIFYGNDLFFSLDQEGLNWLDKAQVNESVNRLLPRNLEFDLKVKNAIKPIISLGCVCSQDTADMFQEFLNDFEFNGVNISFRVEWINYSEISFPVTLDLVLLFNTIIPDNKRKQLERYLKYDRGIIEISSLDELTLGYPIYQDIFNLEWVDESLPLVDYDAEFQETGIGDKNYKFSKYFYHVPLRVGLTPRTPPQGVTSCTGKYMSGLFSFRENTYTVWVIDNSSSTCDLGLYIDINGNNDLDEPGEGYYSAGDTIELDGYNFLAGEIDWNYSDIIFQESPEYRFRFSNLPETIHPKDNVSEKIILNRGDETYPDGRTVPVSIINYNMVNGKGRVAWLSNSSVQELKSSTEQLIKTLIIWAAGEKYQLITGMEKTSPVTLYFYKTLNQDMFQPIGLELTIGYR